jgi:hypothetical protein
MYRDSLDSILAENARLRDELQTLRGDMAALQKMRAPRRALGLVAAGILLAGVLANLVGPAAGLTEKSDIDACWRENQFLSRSLDQARDELLLEGRASATRQQESFRLAREVEECRGSAQDSAGCMHLFESGCPHSMQDAPPWP